MVSNWVEDKPPSDACNLQENKEHRVENKMIFQDISQYGHILPFNGSDLRSLR